MAIIYILTGILAACSILYELLIAQTIVFFIANTVVCYSVTIGLYLLFMGLGALLESKLANRYSNWGKLFTVEVLLSIFGCISVILIKTAHIYYYYIFKWGAIWDGVGIFFGTYILLVLFIGVLSGVELPLLIRIANERKNNETNKVLASDYFGSLIATVAFPLILLPNLELISISFLVGSINLIVALVIFLKFQRQSMYKGMVLVIVMSAVAFGIFKIDATQQFFLKKFYFHVKSAESQESLLAPLDDISDIERHSTMYQKIDIISIPIEESSIVLPIQEAYSNKKRKDPFTDHRVFMNGDFQFSDKYEEFYHEFIVHVPLIVHKKIPQEVLVLGAGDGLLIRELLKHNDIKSITLVDIDRKVIELAQTHPVFLKSNLGSFSDNRVNVIYQDAYHFIQRTKKKFDAIYIDIPIPNDYHLSKLYSVEFFSFVNKRLKEDGLVSFEAPTVGEFLQLDVYGNLVMSKNNTWHHYYNTVLAAGFLSIQPFVVNLDRDNPKAFENLNIWKQKFGVQEEVPFNRIIDNYVSELRSGFIMLKKTPSIGKREYMDLGIKTFTLNEEGFYRAFALEDHFTRERDSALINSIMKPTIPDISNWYWIKIP